jgi:hypothetical protein
LILALISSFEKFRENVLVSSDPTKKIVATIFFFFFLGGGGRNGMEVMASLNLFLF